MNLQKHLIIRNRAALAAVDGWIHIVPKGELPNAEAGIVQVLDDPALDAILAGIEKDKNRLGANWPGIYAGREHFIYDPDKDSAALAWFKDFEKRPNGIWAKGDGLTPTGEAALKNREYKFTSFVTDPAHLEKTPEATDNRPHYRVLKIETVGFTNQANGKELLTPIMNRSLQAATTPEDGRRPDGKQDFASGPADVRPGETADDQPLIPQNKKMNTVCTLLGLPGDSEETAVHAAVTRLLNRGDIMPDGLATLRTEHQALGEQNEWLLAEQTETLLDACGVKEEKIRNRLKDGLKALKNRAERMDYLADFGFGPGKAGLDRRPGLQFACLIGARARRAKTGRQFPATVGNSRKKSRIARANCKAAASVLLTIAGTRRDGKCCCANDE